MSYAQIDLRFEKVSSLLTTEYLLKTEVSSAVTTPDVVDSCLVVQKGDASVAEELQRVATYGQLISTPLPPLPSEVDVFSSPSLPLAQIGSPLAPTALVAGDIIHVTAPDVWQQFFSISPIEDYEVVTVVNSTTVTVTPSFPAFGRNLAFTVSRGGVTILPVGAPIVNPVDGLANRNYIATPTAEEYLAALHVDSWTDLTAAENRVTNLKAQAKSLITALNAADWTGTERVVYP